MHLIETYAANSGATIARPEVYQKFYPLPFKRYVVFQPHSKPLKTYDYWPEVLDLIIPHLHQNGIHVLQIGGPNEPKYPNVYDTSGLTELTQVNYLIANSLMIFGVDSFGAHMASILGKKIVCLYSNNNINNVRPYWSKPEDVSLIEPKRAGKPYYAIDNQFKEVNMIRPEEIAQAIFEKLGIKEYRFNFKTECFGEFFHQKSIELVPNQAVPPSSFGTNQLIIRMDLEHNEEVLAAQFTLGKTIIIANKPISIDLIKNNRDKISQFIYKLDENFNTEFANKLVESGVNHIFLTFASGELLNKIKLAFIDIGLIICKDKKQIKNIKFSNKLFYKNGKVIVSNGKFFPSVYALKQGTYMNDLSSKFFEISDLETKDFEEEFDNYGFYSLV